MLNSFSQFGSCFRFPYWTNLRNELPRRAQILR